MFDIGRKGGMVSLVAIAAAGFLALAPAESAAQDPGLQVSGKLWIEGGSTVRSWDCEAKEIQVRATTREGLEALGIEGLADAVTAMQVQIPKAQLDCDDNTMNDHMWNALKASDHSTITFRMEGYRVVPGPDGGTRVELRGPLGIAGETQSTTFTLDASEEGAGLRLRGVHTLNMTEWGVRPPRLFLGTLRVHENVEVHFDLLLTRRGLN